MQFYYLLTRDNFTAFFLGSLSTFLCLTVPVFIFFLVEISKIPKTRETRRLKRKLKLTKGWLSLSTIPLTKFQFFQQIRQQEKLNGKNKTFQLISDYIFSPSTSPVKKNLKVHEALDTSRFTILKDDKLLFFKDETETDLLSSISLAKFKVDLYPKNVKEIDLYLKFNPIRLISKENEGEVYYLYADNASDKEDWFMLIYEASTLPTDMDIEMQEKIIQKKLQFKETLKYSMSKLISTVKSQGESSGNSEWLNAIIGRMFVSIHEDFKIKNHLISKIENILKANSATQHQFLGDIVIDKLEIGDSIPMLTNPKLLEISSNGSVSVEMDIEYNGGAQIVAGTTAVISVPSLDNFIKVSPFEMPLVLGIAIRKFKAKVLLKIKPNFESNRIWFGLYGDPGMHLELEITLERNLLNKAIQLEVLNHYIVNRIKAKLNELIVLPEMESIPFWCSNGAGGIFQDEDINEEYSEQGMIEKELNSSRKTSTNMDSDLSTDIIQDSINVMSDENHSERLSLQKDSLSVTSANSNEELAKYVFESFHSDPLTGEEEDTKKDTFEALVLDSDPSATNSLETSLSESVSSSNFRNLLNNEECSTPSLTFTPPTILTPVLNNSYISKSLDFISSQALSYGLDDSAKTILVKAKEYGIDNRVKTIGEWVGLNNWIQYTPGNSPTVSTNKLAAEHITDSRSSVIKKKGSKVFDKWGLNLSTTPLNKQLDTQNLSKLMNTKSVQGSSATPIVKTPEHYIHNVNSPSIPKYFNRNDVQSSSKLEMKIIDDDKIKLDAAKEKGMLDVNILGHNVLSDKYDSSGFLAVENEELIEPLKLSTVELNDTDTLTVAEKINLDCESPNCTSDNTSKILVTEGKDIVLDISNVESNVLSISKECSFVVNSKSECNIEFDSENFQLSTQKSDWEGKKEKVAKKEEKISFICTDKIDQSSLSLVENEKIIPAQHLAVVAVMSDEDKNILNNDCTLLEKVNDKFSENLINNSNQFFLEDATSVTNLVDSVEKKEDLNTYDSDDEESIDLDKLILDLEISQKNKKLFFEHQEQHLAENAEEIKSNNKLTLNKINHSLEELEHIHDDSSKLSTLESSDSSTDNSTDNVEKKIVMDKNVFINGNSIDFNPLISFLHTLNNNVDSKLKYEIDEIHLNSEKVQNLPNAEEDTLNKRIDTKPLVAFLNSVSATNTSNSMGKENAAGKNDVACNTELEIKPLVNFLNTLKKKDSKFDFASDPECEKEVKNLCEFKNTEPEVEWNASCTTVIEAKNRQRTEAKIVLNTIENTKIENQNDYLNTPKDCHENPAEITDKADSDQPEVVVEHNDINFSLEKKNSETTYSSFSPTYDIFNFISALPIVGPTIKLVQSGSYGSSSSLHCVNAEEKED
ncbi:hypothetical protein HDU92_001640 [Lobulomyces angularis]|nr:hypothetical protein HDU92_001640 [Lobulomyces angularis]